MFIASMFIMSASFEFVRLNSQAFRIDCSLSVALITLLAGVVFLLELLDRVGAGDGIAYLVETADLNEEENRKVHVLGHIQRNSANLETAVASD
jgi:hypothetical protein